MKGETAIEDDIQKDTTAEKSDYKEALDLLFNDKFKRRKTILNNEQVHLITTMDVIAQIYDIPFLKSWIDWYGEWRTSGDGGIGRSDIVEISKYRHAEETARFEDIFQLMGGKR